MSFDFDGRVAIVTGAGRGIGRAYALLLGELGAMVVVNDLGGSTAGAGSDATPASEVVAEIRAAGGTAAADFNDISSVEGGAGVIETAIREFGRVDIVVNNAGNTIWGALPELDVETLEAILAVHVKGSFNVTRAAWPHMLAQDYGRIVMTTSAGMFGLPDNLAYATAKAGIVGMTNSLAVATAKTNIKINAIAPNAMTRLAAHGDDEVPPTPPEWDSSLVAPMVAFLAHESCPVNGEVYLAGMGKFSKVFVAATPGYTIADPLRSSIEEVAANWDAINAEDGYYVPTSLPNWASHYMGGIRK